MIFTCRKNDLLHGVQVSFNAVSSRATLPILSNILVESTTGGINLTSTDLEVSIKCSVTAEISAQGSITIPAKKFLDIVRELPDEEVGVKVSETHQITVSCGKSIFKLNGLPKDEYPILPKVKKDEGVNLAQSTLQDMIRKTLFAVSTDETRYVLNGILVMIEQDQMHMVATDGHRLAFKTSKLQKQAKQKIHHIVPSKALQELAKIMGGEGEINIQLHDNQIIFSSADVVLMSRLIDGQFPNYDQVIPKQSTVKVEANVERFMSATKRVALMASDKSNSVKFQFNPASVIISANTPEIGEAQEEMDVHIEGGTLTVAYNAKYIMDVLKNIGSEALVFELTTNLNPGVIKPKDGGADYLCVIMPMRI